MKRIFLLFLLFFCIKGFIFSENIKYVKKNNVKLYKTNNARADVIKILSKNTEVFVNQQIGRFVNVNVSDDISGWLFCFYLTSVTPEVNKKNNSFLSKLNSDDYASRESSVKANIRGLNKFSEEYAKNKGFSEASIDTVKKMENYRVSSAKLERFMKEKKLKKYYEQ